MKDLYREYYQQSNHLPLFGQPWWLDAVCGPSNWEALIAPDANGQIKHAIPQFLYKIKGLEAWVQPPLTQYIPIISATQVQIKKPSTYYKTAQSIQKWVQQIPQHPIVEINMEPDFMHALAFHWSGYSLHQRVTFRLKSDSSMVMSQSYTTNLKRNLSAAKKVYRIENSTDTGVLYDLMKMSYDRQKGAMHESKKIVELAAEGLIKRRCGEILTAKDEKGDVIGAILIAWDSQFTYYLGGGQAALNGAPAPHSLLLDAAITSCYQKGLTFDFCGSMIPGVARFFASFGAKPTYFSSIRKYSGVGRLKNMKKSLFE